MNIVENRESRGYLNDDVVKLYSRSLFSRCWHRTLNIFIAFDMMLNVGVTQFYSEFHLTQLNYIVGTNLQS